MPNRYRYTPLPPAEFSSALKQAGLTTSGFMKISGAHYSDVASALKDKGLTKPAQIITLLFLAERPEFTPVMLDIAGAKIVGNAEKSKGAKHIEVQE